jgi:hypothetical protein
MKDKGENQDEIDINGGVLFINLVRIRSQLKPSQPIQLSDEFELKFPELSPKQMK